MRQRKTAGGGDSSRTRNGLLATHEITSSKSRGGWCVVRCGSLILRSLTRNPKMGTDDSPHVCCTQFSRGTWTRSVGTINRSSHFTSRAENDGRMTENGSQRNEGRVHALGRQTLDGSFHSSRLSVFARVYSRASPLRDMFKTHTRRVTKASESEVFTTPCR